LDLDDGLDLQRKALFSLDDNQKGYSRFNTLMRYLMAPKH
jgi:hypothetical protein